jgi:hypothetical protein
MAISWHFVAQIKKKKRKKGKEKGDGRRKQR